MIRDFFAVPKQRNLKVEIDQIADKVDPTIFDAINAVRSMGNIGAHMESEIDVIVDVDPEEAGLLIGLIEQLLEDWYVARYERAERVRKVKDLAAKKEEARKGGAAPTLAAEPPALSEAPSGVAPEPAG